MTDFVEIECEPVGGKPGRYMVWHYGDILLPSCRDPETDAARELVAMGISMDSVLVAYGRGDPVPRLTGRVGYMAGKTVTEGQSGGPRLVNWKPYFGPESEDSDPLSS